MNPYCSGKIWKLSAHHTVPSKIDINQCLIVITGVRPKSGLLP